MIIHTIKCKNFKSFRDPIEINFDRLKGLYKISGRIGAGKTTIGEAIIFGLFGSISGKNNSDLISWGEKHATVEIWYTCRGNDIYIKREINSYGQNPIYAEVNGEELTFTNKRDAQSILEREYMDATRTIMELLCIISFNSFTSLSTLNTKQSKEFLDYVFNFDVLSQYVDGCRTQINQLKQRTITKQAKLEILYTQLTRLKNLVTGDKDAIEQDISAITTQINERKKSDRAEVKELNEQLRTLHGRLGEIKAAGKQVKKEIDLIKKGNCPTCGQPIKSDHLGDKENERKVLLDAYADIDGQIKALTEQISQKEKESRTYIAEQEKLVKTRENELAKLREQARYSTVESKQVEKDIAEIESEINQLEIDKVEYEQLYNILANDVKQSVLGSFIPSLNNNIMEIAQMLGMEFVPEFGIDFSCFLKKGSVQIPTSSLSTGQLKLTDMVIILAMLSSVMARVSTNIIFLDELFSNLDPNTRTELINVLRYVLPKDSTILIVSHQEIDADLFDGQLKLQLVENDRKQKQTNIIYTYK